jgi:hypothetical protein
MVGVMNPSVSLLSQFPTLPVRDSIVGANQVPDGTTHGFIEELSVLLPRRTGDGHAIKQPREQYANIKKPKPAQIILGNPKSTAA